jgi:ATP-dependent HslUV protease ATP-binding subunit HslU
MVIQLPATSDGLRSGGDLTPRQIVGELDRFVVGQAAAKRAVAIALRNRQRRQRLPPEAAAEISPKNILMIGPTGVGKTEIARRLAHLSGSPFLKVEASKFTEVGYVGRDVDSIVRDLTETAVHMRRAEKRTEVRGTAERAVEERLLDLLLPPVRPGSSATQAEPGAGPSEAPPRESAHATREKLRAQLRTGQLDSRRVEVEVRERNTPSFQVMTSQGVEEMDVNLRDIMPGLFGGGRKRPLPIPDARRVLLREEEDRLIDAERVSQEAIERVQMTGIVFLDEIDKIAGRERGQGPEVSREGVQRDLLPMLEGTTVNTKHGPVRTDHILFIAAGAFHVARPSDLIPELQGRFPIRVELQPLGQTELERILVEPKNALVTQYRDLLSTEGVELMFTPEAIREVASVAMQVNDATENIGARRLATILECLLEEVSFDAPDLRGRAVTIDVEQVRERVAPLLKDQNLSRFVL